MLSFANSFPCSSANLARVTGKPGVNCCKQALTLIALLGLEFSVCTLDSVGNDG
jgi:hypothetical protein